MNRILAALMCMILLLTGCVAFAEAGETAATETAETEAATTEATTTETAATETAGNEGEQQWVLTETTPEPVEEPAGRLAGLIIGIDPGHQEHANSKKELSSPKGKEKKARVSSGTAGTSTRIPEYVTVLEISLKLRDILEAEGATVVMTRETHDVDISNYERAMLMNKAKADLVLRIHCDGSDSKKANGITTYVRKKIAYGKDVVKDPAALLKAEADAAECIVNAMCKSTGSNNRGVIKRDTYTMNNWSTVPIILVECGFMSNKEEDIKLNDPDYQQLLAEGMVNGICEYFGR